MATIQFYPDELDYVNAKLHPRAGSGSYVTAVCRAALAADGQNYEVLRPVLHFLMGKYPADPELLAREHEVR